MAIKLSALPPPTTPSKKSPARGIKLAAAPLGPKKRYGIRREFAPPCTVIVPEYAPAAGTDPEMVATAITDAPGASVALGGATITEAAPLATAGVTPKERLTLAVPEFVM